MAADLGTLLPAESQLTAWWLAVVFVALLVAAFAPLVASRRKARFWALGSALSIVPVCATFPTNRVLFFSGLGGMALVTLWLERWWIGRFAGVRRWVGASVAFVLVLTHFLLAPLLLPLAARALKTLGEPIGRSILSLPADRALVNQELIVVNAPDYLLYVSQITPLLHLEHRPIPRRVRGLAIGPSAVDITRVDSRTLVSTMARGYLGGPLGALYRKRGDHLAAGSVITLDNRQSATAWRSRPRRGLSTS
jgi:hypothetical protein